MICPSVIFSFLSQLYLFFMKKDYHYFIDNLSQAKKTQINLLRAIYRHPQMADNEILELHLKTPIRGYDELPKAYHQAKKGDIHPINGESIQVIEPTSGSSGRKKRILYTKSTMRLFQKMFIIWLFDILKYHGPFKTGKTYISLSPRFAKEQDEGLESDQGYLDIVSQLLLRPFILCPARIGRIKRSDDFFMVLSLYFISEENLEIISVWSPSFLVSIFKTLQSQKNELIDSLKKGSFDTKCGQHYIYRCSMERIEIFKRGHIEQLFLKVRFISCWKLTSALQDIQIIKNYIPNAEIQAKGLLATESPMTIPVLDKSSPLPFYTHIFFDFFDDKGGHCFLWELKEGMTYEIIFSHQGGFIKYRLGDLVKVTGFVKDVPILEFFSRSGAVTDLVGEKITESFLNDIHLKLAPELNWILIPTISLENEKGYELFFEGPSEKALLIKDAIESSYHFAHALQLNQLMPINVSSVESLTEKVTLFFENNGVIRGDQKKSLLVYREKDRLLADWLRSQKSS